MKMHPLEERVEQHLDRVLRDAADAIEDLRAATGAGSDDDGFLRAERTAGKRTHSPICCETWPCSSS